MIHLKDNPNQEISDLVSVMAHGMLEQRAEVVDRAMFDQLLVQMLLRYANAERELTELNQIKNRFLGMAAHDLRNPLTALRGMSELLLDMELEPEQRLEFLQEIRKTANDMLTLVNDLLDVAVIESGKLDIRTKQGCFAKLVNNRIKLLAPGAKAKSIRIETDLPAEAIGWFDPDRSAQVVDNLLSNAIKFSRVGGDILVSVRDAGTSIRLSVRDSGPGITDEDQKKLFGTFQKLAARPTAGEKSTGLGLAIVKKIVDAHNGSIEVSNVPGIGAEFTVSYPKGSTA